ncbi:hypothetical protein [Paraburkholderia aromaticivorans]|uniref:hypothetical protein n=1 Tax=Paraburkholderia aromaticivorans TaxID=2026199 RepID=UPI0014562655|nr:hypothetical protein [Paraburkholderia aromaticivorans]
MPLPEFLEPAACADGKGDCLEDARLVSSLSSVVDSDTFFAKAAMTDEDASEFELFWMHRRNTAVETNLLKNA